MAVAVNVKAFALLAALLVVLSGFPALAGAGASRLSPPSRPAAGPSPAR